MFGPLSSDEKNRITRLPQINRARGYRLYAADGSRWLDCWVDGGRGLLGHRPGGVSLRLKNEIDRGIYAPYPNRWSRRLESAVMELFPGYSQVGVFENAERAREYLGLPAGPIDPLDLPSSSNRIPGAAWGRPLLPEHPRADWLFPILPIPGLSSPQVVLAAESDPELPESDLVSPVILAALTRSCAGLRDTAIVPIGESADIWEKRGPYMVYRGDEQAYDGVFDNYFSRNVLISPSAKRPSIYPLELSEHERGLLNNGDTG